MHRTLKKKKVLFGVGTGLVQGALGFQQNISSGDAACMASLCHGDCIEKCWLAPKKPQVGPLTPLGSRLASGLLERPVLPPPVAIDTASYKIFVSGKSGVGKTALVAKLAGLEVPVVHHETTGESLLGGLPWGGEKTRPGPHELESVTSPTCYSATPESHSPL